MVRVSVRERKKQNKKEKEAEKQRTDYSCSADASSVDTATVEATTARHCSAGGDTRAGRYASHTVSSSIRGCKPTNTNAAQNARSPAAATNTDS